ncbi:DNA mismatch repair protein MutS [Botrimarina colliarenosi]|uniref:DNA mismatch repair protein MutS n=1 Tax=Botrimarina colliarenosi TaxID=2528001 RepID=A0A5C6AJC8_9BACT|nr:DNA mismatch repair protein MutS [Botrimarina colliarenosi]TWT99348.1 DNA mismatch repair protein MutS [Botrimarina colliarenosi]
MSQLSPMMQQYHEAKEASGDALLLFRMGDFYELFYDDAKDAGRLLGITVTSRDKDKGAKAVPMAGFPHHQLDAYLAKILRCGRRAAVCEQMDAPNGKAAGEPKGIVRREVTRIVSAGTVTDDELLDPQASNYLVAVAYDGQAPKGDARPLVGLAWIDVSTGEFTATGIDERRLADELSRLDAAECLVAEGSDALLPPEASDRSAVTRRPAWSFGVQMAMESLRKHFGTQSLEGFGFDSTMHHDALALSAAGAILGYLHETQKSSLAHVDRLRPFQADSALQIDAATWRSLEVTHTLRDGRRDGALLGVIDRTVTGAGARRLADWLRRPLTSVASISQRQGAVAELVENPSLATTVREELRGVYDLQRLVARATTGRASPRDLASVGRTLGALPRIKAKLAGRQSERLARLEERIDLCADLREQLTAALVDDCPLSPREGGFLREGYSAELDEYRQLMAGGKQWMASYQAKIAAESDIPSIKVGFNKVFGYYLEVTHAHTGKVPADFIRKQTLKNAERYITPELKEYEEKVLSAEDRAFALEYDLFLQLREATAEAGKRLLATAEALAEIDVLASLAELARSRGYCRPEVVEEPVLDIEAGRHPVLDLTEPEGTFVPNGVSCCAAKWEVGSGKSEGAASDLNPPTSDFPLPTSVLLLTGPNMAGKSTYIRQTALITLMAQIGSFVPATRAVVGVADRLFARVGASDDVSRGQSTFMVEMTETARILNTATPRSLVILDEIGRGTSTYDGLSLAWAIVEHLHDVVGCRTLFATHYHELTQLEERLPGVGNLSVAVREHEGRVVFLHQIVPGPADKSYGIHVAQLAGVPRSVNERAEAILADLEQAQSERQPTTIAAKASGGLQMTLFETAEHPLLEEIRALDIDRLAPMDAFERLHAWRQRLLAER